MEQYSLKRNVRYIKNIITDPELLLHSFQERISIWYGFVPFFLYLVANEIGLIITYVTGHWVPLNPLPKILPIPDAQYPIYQTVFGPFIKMGGILLFSGCIKVLAKVLQLKVVTIIPIIVFYMFIGGTMGLVAFVIDQLNVWGSFGENIRLGLSFIHPIVLIVDLVYVIMFVRDYCEISLAKAMILVIPSIIVSGPIPGILFR